MNLINNPDYCDNHRKFFTEHPDLIFQHKNFIIETTKTNIIELVAELGTDVMPHIRNQEFRSAQHPYEVRPDVNLFFTTHPLHKYKQIGQHFGCLSQEVNHIPGHYALKRRDLLAKSAVSYANQFISRPSCFNFESQFLKTWLLHDKESCTDFFATISNNNRTHQNLLKERKVVYIKKDVNSHGGKGVTPLNHRKEAVLKQEYQNGGLCGQLKSPKIVQTYVYNPLLIEGHRFDIRVFMLVASTDPVMVFYHDGMARVSLFEYSVNENMRRSLRTNLALGKKDYKDFKKGKGLRGMDEDMIRDAQQWSFKRLEGYLVEKGVIREEGWVESYLRPEFKKVMVHLMRMSAGSLLKRSSVYELYGVDFVLDSEMKLWFIDVNAGPMLGKYSKKMEGLINGMLEDHFEIVVGLMRSRMKRVVGLVNRVVREGRDVEESLGYWRKEFEGISKNWFELEYEPRERNGFVKVMDEGLQGGERYGRLVEEMCL